MNKRELLQFDYRAALIESAGLTQQAVESLLSDIDEIRQRMLGEELNAFHEGTPIDAGLLPLDAGFLDLPDRLLAEYDGDRQGSQLGRIIAAAKRIRERVDRVVVLGIGGSYMGARALMDACCEPYYNELTRADRGGRPRVYFEGNNVDNDATTGLLHLLEQTNARDEFDGRWAIVVISKSGGTLETAVALRQFMRAMESQLGASALPELIVPVTGPSGRLADLADAIGCVDRFLVPEGVGGRFSILSPVGLLPAVILGIDIVALLNGAWLMNGHFQAAAIQENVVAQFLAINLLAAEIGANVRVLSVWNKSLESAGLWYDQLLSESIGKREQGVTPLTVVNTRDLHSRAQQHQEGARDKIINNLVVDQWRCDPLPVGHRDGDEDQLNDLAEDHVAAADGRRLPGYQSGVCR